MKIFIVLLCLGRLSYGSLDTGYPAGLMAECPGMTKNTTLSQKTRESLTVVALKPSDSWLGTEEKICKLSHSGVACVAKHLNFRKRKTLVFISGYLDASFSPIVRSTAMPYLKRDYNVIIMEIYPILHRSYPIAARLTKPLGIMLGDFLALLTYRGLKPDKLELLGGSLGAHIAYYAATRYRVLTHLKPSRLTALDPAGPCFRTLPRSERLNSDAAHKVDAIHTNIDGFGLADPVADIDFYVNGGEFQPAMLYDHLLPCLQLCSHVRSAIYWLISHYEPQKFLAVQCPSLASARHGDCFKGNPQVNVIGPNTNFTRTGIYYLPTLANMPYYMGLDGLKPRKHGVNHYLYKITGDEDIIV